MLLLVFVIATSQAQITNTTGYGIGFIKGEKHLLTSPTRIKKKDIIPLAIIGLSGTGLFLADEFINEEVQLFRQKQASNNIVSSLTHLGDPISLALLPLGGFTIGKLMKNDQLTHTSEVAGLSVIHTAVISIGIKALTGRERPNESNNSFKWHSRFN